MLSDEGYGDHPAQALVSGGVMESHACPERVAYDDQLARIDLRLHEEKIRGAPHIVHLSLAPGEASLALTRTAEIEAERRPSGDSQIKAELNHDAVPHAATHFGMGMADDGGWEGTCSLLG
jgi:hypothetical protein